MKNKTHLARFLIILLLVGGLAFCLDAVRNFDFSNKIEKTQTVVEEESAVIDVVGKASPSVVSVLEKSVVFDFFRGPVSREASIGTGFAIEKDVIVTNRHVVSDTNASYTVVDNDGNRYTVLQVSRDPLNDLAILKIQDGEFPVLTMGDSDVIRVGQTVIAIGNALGRFANTVTKGVVSGIGRGITASSGLGQYQQLEDVIQTDAALNPGNSGGPLLNLSGQVIGVSVAIGQGTENIGFAIPVNYVKELYENFKQGKLTSRPYLGVYHITITKDIAEEQNLPEGAFVRDVVLGSAADEAGIKPNDIITAIDGQKVSTDNNLGKLILKHNVGDKVKLAIWRNEKTLTLTATLKEAPVE
ncbi:MAG: trypsin-like peptidase domain-containing protein [Candidatus Cloacimonetes bacterium]|nr:trypsin-like peptidase domain-containing protein [Candidatus Cloacimonadota bacterium]